MSIFLETVFIIVGSIDFFSAFIFCDSLVHLYKTFGFEEHPVLIHTWEIVPTDQHNQTVAMKQTMQIFHLF